MPAQHASLSSGVRRTLPKDLRKLLQPLCDQAYADATPLYLVGGCVRDLLLNRSASDIDVVVEGPADQLAKAAARRYKAKLIAHPEFLTYTLRFPNGRHLDLVTARTETYAEAAALPVVEAASLQEDLFRRDFSVNAIALSLNESDLGHLWDPFGGLEDLQAKKIRVLHGASFKDDPTRVFRAARFAARFGYELEWRTREWLAESIAQQLPARLSGARLREELVPLLLEDDPRPAFQLLDQWQALTFLIPNLKWQKTHHALFGQVKRGPKQAEPLLMRLLSLVHAIPYPKAVGSLEHLMFPHALLEQVEVALSVLSDLKTGTGRAPRAARKPLTPAVKAFVHNAVRLRAPGAKARQSEGAWERVQESTPCLSGEEVRQLGYKPGPIFTQIFEALRQARWEGKLRTREEEIRFVRHGFPLDDGR